MGYDLHITRREFWSDDEGPAITLEEWSAYARGDAEIEADPENPAPENWRLARHAQKWPLWWDERGEVYTKSPDAAAIGKMVWIARALSATVQGDDGEIYGEDPSDPTAPTPR